MTTQLDLLQQDIYVNNLPVQYDVLSSRKTLVTLINKNFIIRLTPHLDKKSFIIGAGQLWKYLNSSYDENKLFLDAYNSSLKVYTVKLRKSFKIEFHSK